MRWEKGLALVGEAGRLDWFEVNCIVRERAVGCFERVQCITAPDHSHVPSCCVHETHDSSKLRPWMCTQVAEAHVVIRSPRIGLPHIILQSGHEAAQLPLYCPGASLSDAPGFVSLTVAIQPWQVGLLTQTHVSVYRSRETGSTSRSKPQYRCVEMEQHREMGLKMCLLNAMQHCSVVGRNLMRAVQI